MNYRFHPEADEELHKVYEYYEARRQGLGRRFGEAFDEALARVLERPFAWGLLEPPYRLHRLKRFPYGILYEPREEEVVIVAVMHLHRRPGYWKHRVPSN
ncbi:MAG: type II toxin-antitoxin system RelE/ParE family toxin [Pirellulaceae bacterium]|nr:type II toxin-antitoxin system RelE/ParE family toxin [Pirellulaceae bacterium]